MDDPEIWSAIHRMANVLERLKMDRAAGMGVAMDSKIGDKHNSKIEKLEAWLAKPSLDEKGAATADKEGMKGTMLKIKEEIVKAEALEKVVDNANSAEMAAKAVLDNAKSEHKKAKEAYGKALDPIKQQIGIFKEESNTYVKKHPTDKPPESF